MRAEAAHGTRGRYAKGCRCESCRIAYRLYTRHYRTVDRRRNAVHGRRATYIRGCRCEACTIANKLYMRVYMRNYLRRQPNSITSTQSTGE